MHGGAGDIPDSRDQGKHNGCRLAARLGYIHLQSNVTTSALDAVEAAVRSMELDEHFNAGYGSVLDLSGRVSLDVSIMEGRDLRAGAATLFTDILHPITVARRILEHVPHTFLGGQAVNEFASKHGIDTMRPPGQLETQYARDALEAFRRSGKHGVSEIGHADGAAERIFGEVGTVGAVAIDRYGNVASATSTGGMTGKWVGRIGDTPLLGAGTYADNAAGAVSTTGFGEAIMRYNVAARIMQRIELLGESAQEATERVLDGMTARIPDMTAGAITVDKTGAIGVYWTSEKMAWAWQKGEELRYGIKKGEEFVDKV